MKDLSPLVIKAQQGDKNAMEDLIGQCYEGLYYYAYKTVQDPDLAADITQESCVEILSTIDKLREPNAFVVWSRRIVYHQCARHFGPAKELQFEENEDGESILDRIPDENEAVVPDKVVEDKEFKATMQAMLDSLPAEQRSALMLYYYEKLSVSQIAEIQGTTDGTVKSRLNYGRKAVKKQVEDYERKTGVRLHSIAPLPLLLFWLYSEGAASTTAVGASAAVAAAGTAGAAGTAAATTAGSAGAAAAGTAVSAKVAAVAIAATLTAGAAIAVPALLETEEPHTHEYGYHWYSNQTQHWKECECGETSDPEPHKVLETRCRICNRVIFSEGLAYYTGSDYISIQAPGEWEGSKLWIPPQLDGIPVTEVGREAFRNCEELTELYLTGNLTELRYGAFSKCMNLKNIHLSEGLLIIGDLAFSNCNALKTVVIPEGVTTIGSCAFLSCTNLREVTIPATVHTLYENAFSYCSSLQVIHFGGTKEQWMDLAGNRDWLNLWDDSTGDYTVYCTDGTLTKAETHNN